ncbi:threonine/serine ThrE exporter family protein [Roseburia sp. MSJ-14]|uniref:threonine/serine ThrE exporter family protein n=1 Tax=Roseburia sp. MSJ-14 TaxID=2841514 RepID=UPI001C12726B|nr:threonine/serine exporter family protein [Roseburia sp. MSJ-14]MBU5472138.1 threonine/serine exporter family protein [Roseburia sp. MSJ-14]
MKTANTLRNIKKNHMDVLWHEYADKTDSTPITQASLPAKASVVGRVGIMMLSCGTGAWRVRSSMNELSELMNMTCTVDIGLMSINYTCFDGNDSFSQSLCLTNTGVNTSQLNRLEKLVSNFSTNELTQSCEKIHSILDQIEKIHGLYSPATLAIAAALACGAFTFLLGGGIVEMLCAFAGAGIGNYIRCKLSKHHFTLFLCIISSVSAACLTYTVLLKLLEIIFAVNLQHEAGYICSMLFIIPGFPFITSGIDLAKLDMRSGIERFMYSMIIITVATMTAWILAMLLGLKPIPFLPLNLVLWQWILLRLLTSFCGVFGFSIMFNSPIRLATAAGIIGAASNTIRLELIELFTLPPAAAAFIGAFIAGILASTLKGVAGYPRISITVPSIVIMVPGLYLYKGFYNLGIMNLTAAASWLASALLIILALPLGLIFARIITDKTFRYCT